MARIFRVSVKFWQQSGRIVWLGHAIRAKVISFWILRSIGLEQLLDDSEQEFPVLHHKWACEEARSLRLHFLWTSKLHSITNWPNLLVSFPNKTPWTRPLNWSIFLRNRPRSMGQRWYNNSNFGSPPRLIPLKSSKKWENWFLGLPRSNDFESWRRSRFWWWAHLCWSGILKQRDWLEAL